MSGGIRDCLAGFLRRICDSSPRAASYGVPYGSVLTELAREHGVKDGAVVLAWLLRRSPVLLPIAGTGDRQHLADNMAGAGLDWSEAKYNALDAQGCAAWQTTQP